MRKQLLQRFAKRLDRLERTQKRAEELLAGDQLRKTDVEAIYEGLFLRAVTRFEGFVEEYFHLVLDAKAGFTQSAQVGCRLTATSSELGEIILQGKKYVDWLPFEKTRYLAEMYLKGGRPFVTLGKPHVDALDRCVTLRHAIAHSSAHAKRRFESVVLQNLVLRPDERNPAGFLRNIAIYPNTRRFNVLVGEMRAAAIELTT